jgi:Flp pilus assembly protein TadG
MSGRLQQLRRDACGATAVETALLMPLMLLLLLGAMEIGRLAWTQMVLNNAVQDLARCAAVTKATCGNADQVAAEGAKRIQQARLINTSVTFAFDPAATCGRQVTASAEYGFLIKKLAPAMPHISASVCRA